MFNAEQIYVRVKRHNQTFFIPCEPDDKVRKIKSNISLALKNSENDSGVTEDQMRLLLPAPAHTILEDDNKVSSYKEIKNDVLLHVIFQLSENEWEAVAVDADASATPS